MTNNNVTPYDRTVALRTVTLERVSFSAKIVISDAFLESARLETEELFTSAVSGIAVRLRAQVYGYQRGEEAHKYPADWWEAFKDRWAPRWYLQRWPVRWTTVRFTAWHLYPELRIQDQGPIRFVAVDESGTVA